MSAFVDLVNFSFGPPANGAAYMRQGIALAASGQHKCFQGREQFVHLIHLFFQAIDVVLRNTALCFFRFRSQIRPQGKKMRLDLQKRFPVAAIINFIQ